MHYLALPTACGVCAIIPMFWAGQHPGYSTYQPSNQNAASIRSNSPEEHNESGWAWITKDAAGFFTLLLVLVGGIQALLFWVQLKAIREALDPAQKAAKAAQLNAQAIIDAERARFYVVIAEDNFLTAINEITNGARNANDDDAPINFIPSAKIFFRNYGKTPGIVSEIGIAILVNAGLPDPVFDVRPIVEEMIPANGTTEQFNAVLWPTLTFAGARRLYKGEVDLWLSGYILYTDTFGKPQAHRFLKRFSQISAGRWILQSVDHKRYNQSS